MNVWLDDIRDPRNPHIQMNSGASGDEVWVKTASQAIQLLLSGRVTSISLDHDLGPGAGDGYEVACWIEQQAYAGSLARLGWEVHSQNRVGKANMIRALRNADKYWGLTK